ncbi:hypothetical protein OGAPHI_000791 [Ogataea philodendri]|uniref:Uncharacterized protein n=1 Tax=Ogataea philodendri TaxID=1378263 RepID=A0A9P8PGF0_9ASCO|nr:uncharacterized protein OGAPHI_000791 [Ogataea philodendri]KAH3671080.1 hypothetical protein OGAPHI_000791 [Ogataea philodendri]
MLSSLAGIAYVTRSGSQLVSTIPILGIRDCAASPRAVLLSSALRVTTRSGFNVDLSSKSVRSRPVGTSLMSTSIRGLAFRKLLVIVPGTHLLATYIPLHRPAAARTAQNDSCSPLLTNALNRRLNLRMAKSSLLSVGIGVEFKSSSNSSLDRFFSSSRTLETGSVFAATGSSVATDSVTAAALTAVLSRTADEAIKRLMYRLMLLVD